MKAAHLIPLLGPFKRYWILATLFLRRWRFFPHLPPSKNVDRYGAYSWPIQAETEDGRRLFGNAHVYWANNEVVSGPLPIAFVLFSSIDDALCGVGTGNMYELAPENIRRWRLIGMHDEWADPPAYSWKDALREVRWRLRDGQEALE